MKSTRPIGPVKRVTITKPHFSTGDSGVRAMSLATNTNEATTSANQSSMIPSSINSAPPSCGPQSCGECDAAGLAQRARIVLLDGDGLSSTPTVIGVPPRRWSPGDQQRVRGKGVAGFSLGERLSAASFPSRGRRVVARTRAHHVASPCGSKPPAGGERVLPRRGDGQDVVALAYLCGSALNVVAQLVEQK